MTRVLVCGLPGSGNHLCVQHLRRSGYSPLLHHAFNEKPWREFLEGYGSRSWALYPIRLDEEARRRSASRKGRGGGFSLDEGNLRMMRQRVAELRIPVFPVIFEHILSTGGAALDRAIIAAGGIPAPWPKEVHDDPDHPEFGRVLSNEERLALPGRR